MLNTQDVVDLYIRNTNLKIADVAAAFSIKAADVSSILRLAGVKTRRGGVNGPSREAIDRAIATRQRKAMERKVAQLTQRYGSDVITAVSVTSELNTTTNDVDTNAAA